MVSESNNNRPILRVIVSASNPADDKQLQAALGQILQQDASVRMGTKQREGYYSLEGKAESELDSLCDRLRDEYKLMINVGAPSAILLETIRKQAEAEGKYIRQTGGSGNYGHCKLRVEPNKGYEFINDIKGGVVPKEFIKPIEQGVQDAMEFGILAGFQMVDIKVTLFDGSYHELDSNEMAFKFAGSIAFREATRKAGPVLLEPMMAVEIELPESLAGGIRREIQMHRGRIESNDVRNSLRAIKALVPLSELLASSSGIAVCPIEFAGYEVVRDGGSEDEGGPGVTANKPNGPPLGERSQTARPDFEGD